LILKTKAQPKKPLFKIKDRLKTSETFKGMLLKSEQPEIGGNEGEVLSRVDGGGGGQHPPLLLRVVPTLPAPLPSHFRAKQAVSISTSGLF